MESKELAKSRVLIIVTHGVLEFGGYFLRVKKEIELLRKSEFRGLDLLVLLRNPAKCANDLDSLALRLSVQTVHAVNVKMIPAIARLLNNYQILHAQNLIAAFVTCVCTRIISNKPTLIFDYHGASPEENYYLYNNHFTFFLYKLFEKIALRFSDRVIVVSESFRQYLIRKHDVKDHRIFVLRNFMEDTLTNRPYPIKKALRRSLKLPTNRIIIVYSGSFKKWQEEEALLRVADFVEQNESRYFLSILSFDSNIPNRFSELCTNWYRLEKVQRVQVFDYLKAANIGLLVRKDNLINHVADPSKLSEYLISGLSIFGSGIGDLKVWMQDHNLGVFFELNGNMNGHSIPIDKLQKLGDSITGSGYNDSSISVAHKHYSERTAYDSLVRCYSRELITS